MAEEYGANIATKAGDGEANIYHWEGVQKTINDLYTRDLYHQKRVQDEYTKAQSSLATQATGLRAADIPDFQKAYGAFRDASMQLQNRKVYNDANQRAFYSKLKDDSYAEAISLAERSKEATKTKASYYNNWMQSGGLNASDDFHEKMNQFDALSVNQIRDTHFDNPMNFFNPKDDTPKNLNKDILGNTKTIEERNPFYDPKGVKMYDEVNKFNVGSEYPLGVVANNALTKLHGSKRLTSTTRDEFGNIAPQEAKTAIDAANQLVAKETPQAPPLPYDYTGYFAAKWINQARTKTPAGDKKTEYDQLWMDNHNNDQQIANQNRQFAHADASQRKLFAHQDATQAKRDAKVAASYGDMDTEPVYRALRTGDREASWKALSAVASNNPDKPVPFMVSRLDLLDHDKTKELYNQLGIDPASVKYQNTVENDTPQKKRDRIVQASIDAINAKSGGDKISLKDIEMGKIVGGFIHKGEVNEYDPANPGTYKGTKETSLPIIINPQAGSPDRFKALVNNIAVRKNKRELAAQEADMNGVYPGLPSNSFAAGLNAAMGNPPTTTAPSSTRSAAPSGGDEGWIKKILHFEATQGSATGKGLSNWGYNSRNPKSIDEAVGFFKKDILPKVANFPSGVKERMGDFLYNTGKDGRIYMLDQYLKQSGADGLADRGKYKEAMKDGEWKDKQAEKDFNAEWAKHKAAIESLPADEQARLLDQGRDYYYRNINKVNGKPSPAYENTWKHRLGIFNGAPSHTTAPTKKKTGNDYGL